MMRLIIIQFFFSFICASFLLPKFKNVDEIAAKREFHRKLKKASREYIFAKIS